MPKKNGSVRMCVDYRKLNAITKPDKYPLPRIDTALDALEGAQYFSLLDLRSGFYQIAMHPEDKEKTAFIVEFGLFQFTRLSMGLTNSASSFQRVLDRVLAPLKYNSCLVYIDDIVVFAKTFDEHLVKLRNVFKHLEEAGLVLQPPKCEFLLDEILYLGHVVGRDGQKPDERKIASVKNFPTPLCLTDVRSFLGLCSYYRKFIPNFAITAKPLTDLTKKETSFNWQKEQQEAFEELKRKLISYPVLAHYDPSRETQIRTDACAYGIGAILLQKIDEDWHPIAYMSRLLKKSQLNYHISDKECYAIVEAINKWRAYLDGIRFEVMTDHCSLCYLVTKKDLSPRLTSVLSTSLASTTMMSTRCPDTL